MKSGKQRKQEIKEARARRAEKASAAKITPPKKELNAGQAPCNEAGLAPYNSYGCPRFVERGYYEDILFECKDCGVKEIWRATQQKWWYEVAKGHVDTTAIRCRPCRIKERKRKDEARRIHQEGLSKD